MVPSCVERQTEGPSPRTNEVRARVRLSTDGPRHIPMSRARCEVIAPMMSRRAKSSRASHLRFRSSRQHISVRSARDPGLTRPTPPCNPTLTNPNPESQPHKSRLGFSPPYDSEACADVIASHAGDAPHACTNSGLTARVVNCDELPSSLARDGAEVPAPAPAPAPASAPAPAPALCSCASSTPASVFWMMSVESRPPPWCAPGWR